LKGKGSALVEFVLCVPVLLLLWTALWHIGSFYAVKQRLAVAARYAAWTDACSAVDPSGQARLRAASASQFLAPSKLLAGGEVRRLKLYFLSDEKAVELGYPVELPGAGAFSVREHYTLSGNSWRIADLSGRKAYYGDKIGSGDTDFRNWKGAGNENGNNIYGNY